MPMYTFYPSRSDGSPISFEAFELPDDREAAARAELVLRQHSSCSLVTAWRDEKIVVRLTAAEDASV